MRYSAKHRNSGVATFVPDDVWMPPEWDAGVSLSDLDESEPSALAVTAAEKPPQPPQECVPRRCPGCGCLIVWESHDGRVACWACEAPPIAAFVKLAYLAVRIVGCEGWLEIGQPFMAYVRQRPRSAPLHEAAADFVQLLRSRSVHLGIDLDLL